MINLSILAVSTSQCNDLEDWCKHEPNCNFEDVRTSCPKYCEVCKGNHRLWDFQHKNSLNFNFC